MFGSLFFLVVMTVSLAFFAASGAAALHASSPGCGWDAQVLTTAAMASFVTFIVCGAAYLVCQLL